MCTMYANTSNKTPPLITLTFACTWYEESTPRVITLKAKEHALRHAYNLLVLLFCLSINIT